MCVSPEETATFAASPASYVVDPVFAGAAAARRSVVHSKAPGGFGLSLVETKAQGLTTMASRGTQPTLLQFASTPQVTRLGQWGKPADVYARTVTSPSARATPALIAAGLTADDLRSQNPWWSGDPQRRLPIGRRWIFPHLLRRLQEPLAPVLLVRGPRQVGKTTVQQQLVDQLLQQGVAPTRILRAQFDDVPSLKNSERALVDLVRWFEREIVGRTFNEAARRDEGVYIFLDEVQNLRAWDVQLKQIVDGADVVCVVTGSSALRIGLRRDSLAGRIQSFDLGTLRLSEIAQVRNFGDLPPSQTSNGTSDWFTAEFWHSLSEHGEHYGDARDASFAAFSERGSYPRSHTSANVPWAEVADQLNETVVRRVIQHDLRIGDRGRKRDPQLLEEVFRLACRYAGQAPRPAALASEARERLQANVGDQRVRHYLDFLDSSLLVRAVQPLETRLKKQRSSPRLCICDHGVRAAWLQESIPLVPAELARAPHLSTVAGHLVESIVGYYLSTLTGLDLAHLPERPDQPEIDFVVTAGTRRLPIEVKYQQRVDAVRDTTGLVSFMNKPANEAHTGLLICQPGSRVTGEPDPRIAIVQLPDFLLVR